MQGSTVGVLKLSVILPVPREEGMAQALQMVTVSEAEIAVKFNCSPEQ